MSPVRLATLAVLLSCGLAHGEQFDDALRLNQIQSIGTHNSYHLAPAPSQLAALRKLKAEWGNALDYSHRPLAEQFEKLGVRHIELDIYADPEGGMFAKPIGAKWLTASDRKELPPHDPDGKLAKPGFKVVHVPDFDYRTTVLTFTGALIAVRDWSKANPRHLPMMILVEMKDHRPVLLSRKPVPIGRAQLEAAEKEIATVFEANHLITPDSVRGDSATLREAVLVKGWPTLKQARGKVLVALDNGGHIREAYLAGNPSLEGRTMFSSAPNTDHPSAAWFKVNDPIGSFDHIQKLTRAGFLVRTRADAETREARTNDTARRDKAFASGAQFISTDFPEAIEAVSKYEVRFEGSNAFRRNPMAP